MKSHCTALLYLCMIDAAQTVDEEQTDLARRAFRKYGKGRHPASLNFGDCFSDALSQALEEPLLFKGNDFPQTDVDCHYASNSGKR